MTIEEATATIFDRLENSSLGQQGKTVEYRDQQGHTLAYLDYSEDGQTARCNVFDPSTDRSRQYEWRPVERAAAIVEKHLQRLGYVAQELAETDVLNAGLPAPMAAAAMAALQDDSEPQEESEPQQESVYADPAVRAAVADVEPQPEFRSVEEAADAILWEPDDVVRHWISRGGTVYQLHLRAIVPAAETADALRAFVESDAHGYTRTAEGKIWLWSSHAWNVGYAVVLPAQ
jgi:hypothetical protein